MKQELEIYEFYVKQIGECDKAIEECYKEFDKRGNNNLTNSKKRKSKNAPKFDLQQSLYNITGINFTTIPGLSELKCTNDSIGSGIRYE